MTCFKQSNNLRFYGVGRFTEMMIEVTKEGVSPFVQWALIYIG